MHGIAFKFAFIAGMLLAASGVHAQPYNKCVVGRTVTYQQDPCPTNHVRKPIDLKALNAAEKKKREAEKAARIAAALSQQKPITYSCDGRKTCGQMSSCDEAKFFLANCKGVQMDGDSNGIPCEKQWCHN